MQLVSRIRRQWQALIGDIEPHLLPPQVNGRVAVKAQVPVLQSGMKLDQGEPHPRKMNPLGAE